MVQGELLLIQQNDIGERMFTYRDHSLVKRLKIPPVPLKTAPDSESKYTKLYT